MQLDVSYIDQILVMLVFAFSLNLVLGYGGIFTAAHAAFGAIGGYALIWLVTHHGWPYLPALILGVVAAAAFGLLLATAALRLDVLWLLLLTLAVQLVLIGILSGIQGLGGSNGMAVQSLSVFGHSLLEPTQILPVVGIGAALTFLLCYRMGESPYGRVLRGIREDEIATRSLGKNVFSHKLSVFVITAGMAGLGGALLSTQNALASPGLFDFTVSVQIIAMVVIGGVGNMFGTVIGVSLVVLATPFFENVIHLSTNVASLTQGLAYGLALVLVIFFRPQGILPEGTSPLAWIRALGRLTSGASTFVRRTGGRNAEPVFAATGPTDQPNLPSDMALESSGNGRVAREAGRYKTSTIVRTPDLGAGATKAGGDVAVEVRDISKAFGGILAVDGLSMDLRKGVITALVGPNGAGKTTVFNLLTGAIPVDAGRVHLNGKDVTGLRPDVITKLGMARSFQDVRIFPALSVLDNVILGVQHQPGEKLRNLFLRPILTSKAEVAAREQAYNWLRFIDMDRLANVRAGSLGFGQQKLIALARILATECEVLLLDEPGSGIDHVWIDEMIGVVKEVRDAGRTVCIVEHNLEVVGQLADHVYFMELGRVTAEGTFEDLTNDPRLAEAYFGAV